ncbi:hypothetical protein BDK51DRAFT_24608, partial [Blyttiomyces helicus]
MSQRAAAQDPGAEGEAVTDQFPRRVREALAKLNIAEAMESAFDLLIPSEQSEKEESQFPGTTRLKELELSEVLRQIISALSANNALVIIIHEAQWMDTPSWELLWEIEVSCPKTAIFIFSRPERYIEDDQNREIFRKFKRLPRGTSLVVDGLSLDETRQLVVNSWSGTAIKTVAKVMLDSIFARTRGNPLFIRSLVTALKESGQWRVDALGTLTTQGESFDFEQVVLGMDLQSAIVAQFDRLDRSFQLFLKMASAVGQRFPVRDVLCFLSDAQASTALFDRSRSAIPVARRIESQDKYGFLARVEGGEGEGLVYEFKSEVVRKCVYTMMVVQQRQQLHLSIAIYYENVLNDSNRHRLLVPLTEHYLKTDDRQKLKKIRYLELVSHLSYEKRMMGATVKNYTMLMQMVNTAQKEIGKVLYNNQTTSRWHRELGEAYFARGNLEAAEEHILESLFLTGHEFPRSSMKLSWRLRRERTARSR